VWAAFDGDMDALRAMELHPAVVASSERRHATAAATAAEAVRRAKAGGVLRTSTRLAFNLLLLLRTSV